MEQFPVDLLLSITNQLDPVTYFLILRKVAKMFCHPALVHAQLAKLRDRLSRIDPLLDTYWHILERGGFIAGSALVHALLGETSWEPGDIDIWTTDATAIPDHENFYCGNGYIRNYVHAFRTDGKVSINLMRNVYLDQPVNITPEAIVRRFDFEFLHNYLDATGLRIYKPESLLSKTTRICHVTCDQEKLRLLQKSRGWYYMLETEARLSTRGNRYRNRGFHIEPRVCQGILETCHLCDPIYEHDTETYHLITTRKVPSDLQRARIESAIPPREPLIS